MIKSILKKVLVFILASSSVILLFTNQSCIASCKIHTLKFFSKDDKKIFLKAYNNMLSCNESTELYKTEDDDFTLGDYNVLKNYILCTDDYDEDEREEIILVCARSILVTKKNFYNRICNYTILESEYEDDNELCFMSYDDEFLFLDSYNVMCFYEGNEICYLSAMSDIKLQQVIDLREFFKNNITFYSEEKVNKILKMASNTINYSNFCKKNYPYDYEKLLDSTSSDSQ